MYSVCSVSLWHKTRRPRQPLGPDVLELIKYGWNNGDNSVVVTHYWGVFRKLSDAMEEIKQIPRGHYQHFLEGETNGVFRYIWEGVVLYEDGRPVCCFDEPWKGRG